METRFYFDTSIWLDFFEDRNEPNFPKTDLINNLIELIIKENYKIIISDNVFYELNMLGYNKPEIYNLLKKLKPFIIFVVSKENQVGKAKDLSKKRGMPKRDALHAIIARDNNAVLITYDNDFNKILDIIKPSTPSNFI